MTDVPQPLPEYILTDSLQRSVPLLAEWKTRYKVNELPGKIVKNVFYELMTFEVFYPFLRSCFEDSVGEDLELPQVVDLLWERYRACQVNEIRPKMTSITDLDLRVDGVAEYSDFIDLLSNNDEGGLQLLERNYIWTVATKNYLLHWGALGLMPSFKKSEFPSCSYPGSAPFDHACYAVFGMVQGGINYDSFPSVWGIFSGLTSKHLEERMPASS